MKVQGNNGLSLDATIAMAQSEQRKSHQEDNKIATQRRDISFEAQIRAKSAQADQDKKKADADQAAESKKSSGGLFGSLGGILLLAVAIAAAFLIPGLGAVVTAAIIGAGAAAMGGGIAAGGAIGSKLSEGSQKEAAEAGKASAALNVDSTDAEKKSNQEKTRADEAREAYKQALQDGRALINSRKEAFDASRGRG